MTQATDPFLVVEDLVVTYGGMLAVDRVDLRLAGQTVTALVGPSGCGKTTLMRTIAGFERPRSGRVLIDGREVAGPSRWVAPEERQVGMVFQQNTLFPHLTVWGNALYGVKRRPGCEELATAALEQVGLLDLRERYPDQLSGGQQQLAALARALAPSPKVILLDEPFAGLDAELRIRLREDVRAILEAARITTLLVTHDQEEALSTADRVAVMGRGRILQVGTPEEIYRRPIAAEVAEFIGRGQLVECAVRQGSVESVFGLLHSDAPDGQGRLLIRPEDLVLFPAESADGPAGRVVRRSFYGHDLVHEIRMDRGQTLRVRVLGSEDTKTGSEVRLGLRADRFRLFIVGRQDATFEAWPSSSASAKALGRP